MKSTSGANVPSILPNLKRRIFGLSQAVFLFLCIPWILHSENVWNLRTKILEGHVSGVVRDTNGAPVEGAIVSFHPGHYLQSSYYSETTSDGMGRYSLRLRMETNGRKGFDSGIKPTPFIMARGLEKNAAVIRVVESFPTNLDLALE